jgi:hypothetical protein
MKWNPIKIKQDQLLTITVVVALLFCNSIYTNQIFGHNFAGDESASFLALMDQIQTEMSLINTNLVDNNQPLAKDHLNKINELYTKNIKNEIAERNDRIANEISSIINETSVAIEKNNQVTSSLVNNFNDIIGEAISVRIDQDALTNATVHALHFADLINSIDLSYADAHGTKPMNMSAMNMGDNSSMSHDNNNNSSTSNNNNNTMPDMKINHGVSPMASMSKDTDTISNATENGTVTNIASYQTAKELTNNAIDLFNSTIKQNISSNATENANAIESGLQQLKDMIESKAPYNKVMGIIHGIIQTNTQEIFNLPLKTSY